MRQNPKQSKGGIEKGTDENKFEHKEFCSRFGFEACNFHKNAALASDLENEIDADVNYCNQSTKTGI